MFGDKDSSSQRRKREEQQVELRRQRTEELLNKKRISSKICEANTSFENSKNLLFSQNIEDIYKGAFECRTQLSVEVNPPIQDIIDSGIVPRFVELLDSAFYSQFGDSPLCSKCRFESAWVITNIASGNTDQTKYVVRLGSVPFLVKMIAENDDLIVDQSVWALGNIAGDSEELRDVVLETGALPVIIKLIERFIASNDHVKILRNLVWLLSNLNRGRSPLPNIENMRLTLSVVEKVIQINDSDIVADCFWCLSYLVDADSDLTDQIIKSQIIQRCYNLMNAFSSQLRNGDYDHKLSKVCAYAVCPIVRMLGNIVTGTESQTDVVIQLGFLQFLNPIFYLYDTKKLPRIRKEICWLLSNVTAGSHSQVVYVFESDLFGLLIDSISRYELYIRKEASFAVLNMLFFCIKAPQYLQQLLDNQVIPALQSYLNAVSNIPEIQAQILDSVRYALEAGEKIKQKLGSNPVVQALIDTKLVDEIEDLQDSNNNVVVQKAYNIIITYFEGEEE